MSAGRLSMAKESLRQSLGRQSLGLGTPGRLSDLNTPSRRLVSRNPTTSQPWAYEFQTMWDRLNSGHDAADALKTAQATRGECSSPAASRGGSPTPEEMDAELPGLPDSDADVTAQYEGEADFGSLFSTASDAPSGPSGEQWVPVYGFQGAVHFMAGNWDSFRSAVRRLLSLPEPNDGAVAASEPYTLVHYDAAEDTMVEMEDDLSLGDDSVGIEYIAKHLVVVRDETKTEGDDASDDDDDDDLYCTEKEAKTESDVAGSMSMSMSMSMSKTKTMMRSEMQTKMQTKMQTASVGHARGPSIDSSALFVRLRDERTPRLWQPTDGQLRTDVSRIVYHASQDQLTPTPPPSCAYVSFPKTAGGPLGKHAGAWDAAQSTAAVRTAVDVLVGQRCHDVFRFHTDLAEDGTSISYGLATLRPADVHALHALQRHAGRGPDEPPRDLHLEHRHLADDHVALVLPGFHPRASECVPFITAADLERRGVSSVPRTLTSTPQLELPGAAAAAAAARIRIMVARFQDAVDDEAVRHADCAAELRCVRLLVGRSDDGTELRHQRQLLLPLRDEPGSILDPVAADALSALAAAPPRSILIFPEYRRRDTRMMAGWKHSAEHQAEHEAEDLDDRTSVALPALGSSAAEFREHVAQLCRLVPLSEDVVAYDPRVHHVSIHPLMPVTSSERGRDATFESTMFFIGPNATDDDWFRVRAQIPTRKAVIRVWPQTKSLDWRMSVARANIWGPRYGRVVAAPEKQEALVPFYRSPVSRRNGTLEDVFAPKARQTPTPARGSPRPQPIKPPEFRLPPVPAPVFRLQPETRASPPRAQEKPKAHIQCPFQGCDFSWRQTDQERGRLALDAHARMRHVARQCLWCDARLGEDDEERDEHLRTRHRDKLLDTLGLTIKTKHQYLGVDDGSTLVPAAYLTANPSANALPDFAREARASMVVARERGETAVPRGRAQLGVAGSRICGAASSYSASPANQEQDKEANKENHHVAVPAEEEETDREDGPGGRFDEEEAETDREDRPVAPLNDDGDETDKENNPPALLDGDASGFTGLVPPADWSPRSREYWALGLRFNSVFSASPRAENEQQMEAAPDNDFEVYEDVEQDEGGGGGGQVRAGRTVLADLPVALGDAAATTPQDEQVDQVGVAKEGHGPKKTPEVEKVAETRGKKRPRLAANEQGEDAAADESAAKRTKTAQAAKGTKAMRATGAKKAAQKKRKAPGPSTASPDDDDTPPAPKRAKKSVPTAEPTRRSARLRGKAKGDRAS